MASRITSDRNKFYYVYVLESVLDGKRYIGMTSDLRRRFQEHADGKSFATAPRRPFTLIYYEAFLSYRDAANKEKYYKTTGGRRSPTQHLRDYCQRRNPKLS